MPGPAPKPATPRQQLLISVYFSILLIGSNMQGLSSLPVSFYLKNHLHVVPWQLSLFGLVTGIPLYLAFLFGLIRDAWRPPRMGDRGYLLAGGLGLSVVSLALAVLRPTWNALLFGMLLTTLFGLIVTTALNALTTLVGRQRLMTGRLSGLSSFWINSCGVLVNLLGGILSEKWALRSVFFLMAGISAMLWIQAFWHSRDVFPSGTEPLPKERAKLDIRPLFQHRAALLAVLIWMLWNFAPGSSTATMYYLTNKIRLSDSQFGLYNAITAAGFIPLFAVYGLLCRRFTLRQLLVWGTLIGIPQFVPILFIHTPFTALAMAVPIGAMGGIASAAYLDLIYRACPRGLEGTMNMLAAAGLAIVGRFGDVLGSWMFERWQYLPCVIAITVVYASILPVLTLIPRTVTDDREEQSEHRMEEYAEA